jgi:hypothetical protein
VKYLPLFHHFKAIYQFPKHIIFLVKIVANAPLTSLSRSLSFFYCHVWLYMYVKKYFIYNCVSFQLNTTLSHAYKSAPHRLLTFKFSMYR